MGDTAVKTGGGNGRKLADLIRGVPCEVYGNKAVEVKSICYHSSRSGPGALFVAISGLRASGVDYIDDAVNRGATCVACSDVGRVQKNWVTVVQTATPRRFLAQVANRFHGFPSRRLSLVGVTGTNGKTTTTYLLRAMARQAGQEPGFVGTIEHYDGARLRPAGQTTPESLEMVQMLSSLVEHGAGLCIAEVSSHALELERVFDLDFRVAVLTNVTQDHLDFHRTMDNYRAAKAKLFTQLGPAAVAVVNYDDALGRDIPHRTRARVVGYGTRPDLEPVPDVSGRVEAVRPDGLDCSVSVEGRVVPVRLRLVGEYQLSNLLAAVAAGRALEWPLEQIVAGAEALAGVPGRLEPVAAGQEFGVFVDYAHTPDALGRMLATVRRFTSGRVLVAFGCGGERDRTKRPQMGETAAKLADVCVVTSDNPRSEKPEEIIEEILSGIEQGGRRKEEGARKSEEGGVKKENGRSSEVVVEPDRAVAIERALRMARPGDTVVVCGKGHEDYQIVGTERRHFDDREVVQAVLRKIAGQAD
ncbi:UDP-N-acetylmuramoyl-L-alanyl-D-glutamate--2,6-diaminopimelate ligase [candidate division WOR-3 bacterium]|nr:UDP-N-acetylmuramoyl-L-alanyl-D-glutamate--2,6-diaminopimelate ligase [candidate division WOR-3 bacterium]